MKTLIQKLKLIPHPEGGYYRETYRATGAIPGKSKRHPHRRSFSTAIYYYLEGKDVSRLHRIKSDEIFHHYSGDAAVVVEITPRGRVIETRLGANVLKGEIPQHVVPAGNWFGVYLPSRSTHALLGCTVAPGFEFRDFEIATELPSEFRKIKHPGVRKLIVT